MTALSEFQRLEATGLYTPEPGAQRRDVVLTLGDATLTIFDSRSEALSHWSLAAVERVNPAKRPALYAPGPDAVERVETGDEEMIRAIEKVRKAVDRERPHPGRLRARLVAAAVLSVILFAVFWLPGALTRYTASVVPAATRAAIGASLIDQIGRLSGPPCSEPSGAAALRTLTGRLFAAGRVPVIRVLRSGVPGAAHLPGQIILLDRAVVEDHESPQVVAGFILSEAEKAARSDPLLSLLDYAGLRATLTLMTTGALPAGALEGYSETYLAAPRTALPPEALMSRFAAAGVSPAPYAYAVDITGESTLALIEADPVGQEKSEPLLTDGQWIALQGICGS
jgi:hypothetical protein